MTTNAIISGAECISTPSTYHTIHKENHMTNVIISEEETEDGLYDKADVGLPPSIATPASEVFAPVKLCRFNQAYRPADVFINPKHIVTVRERRSDGKIFTAIETTSGTIEVKESIEVVVRGIT